MTNREPGQPQPPTQPTWPSQPTQPTWPSHLPSQGAPLAPVAPAGQAMSPALTRPVSPTLPIVTTIAWLLLALVGGLFGPFTLFLFDPGPDAVSVWTWLIFLGIWATLALCLVSIVAGWLAWAISRRRRSGPARALRGAAYVLPLLGLAMTTAGFAGTSLLCSGSLTCT